MAGRGLFSEEIQKALTRGLGRTAVEVTDSDVPGYHFRVNGEEWVIEVVRDNYFPDESAQELRLRGSSVGGRCVAAIFIPEGEESDDVVRVAVARDLPVILKRGAGYALSVVTGSAHAPSVATRTRIPPALADGVGGLVNLNAEFRTALAGFSARHAELRNAVDEAGAAAQERETGLLTETFEDLVRSDGRFIGTHDALDVLRVLESWWQQTGRAKREHYFHSFHNFLLGCVAIDGLHEDFNLWFSEAFPPSGIPLEYVWLLTALFHDVGYVIQKGPDVDAVLFGMDKRVDFGTGRSSDVIPEYESSKRTEFWNSLEYRWHRRQVVSMFDHLTTAVITSDWAPNAFLSEDVPESAFDRAMEESFMSPHSHGAASALVLLRAISKMYASNLAAAARIVVQKSMHVAAVSIPLHDWYFRESLSRNGISALSSRRFPLACLLAYIDSIQEDRREFNGVFAPDVLEALEVSEDRTLVARIAADRIPTDTLAVKQTEARGLMEYVVQDGLKFRYPAEFD
jgi:hypothetical protein